MLDCTTEKYAALYARWLVNPGTLLDMAGWTPGMTLLDLCGGSGAVTREALRRGAHPNDITLVDLNPRAEDTGVKQVQSPMESLPWNMAPRDWDIFDVAVCRQAIGYVNLRSTFARDVHHMLKPGGRFVFNTFGHPRWALRRYTFEGKRFIEASGYLGRMVMHIQASPGLGLDVTKFRWHSDDELHEAFWMFRVGVHADGRSIRWVCTKG